MRHWCSEEKQKDQAPEYATIKSSIFHRFSLKQHCRAPSALPRVFGTHYQPRRIHSATVQASDPATKNIPRSGQGSCEEKN
uniref:Uncharacterized protein n=1 Tax=Acrobeloides nanus TaxID=290746 RepID=A0A914DZ47_9BILA